MAEMDGVSDVTCCFQEINDPFVNVFDSFFWFIFPCRLGRTECSILTHAASATLLKESISCWEVQTDRFPSSQGTGYVWALWESRAAGCGPAKLNQTPTMW